MINVVVGSGTLITFPVLLAFGFPSVLANVSNNIGLVPGSLSGAYGYRAELSGQRDRIIKLGSASLLGGLVGAVLLLTLPKNAFQAIVPVLIVIALIMVVIQPRLARWVAARKIRLQVVNSGPDRDSSDGSGPAGPVSGGPAAGGPVPGGSVSGGGVATAVAPAPAPAPAKVDTGGPLLWILVFCTGVYGGYFGAAQGVLLIGLLGVALDDGLQRINAVKNILAALVNGVAAILFICVSHVAWIPALLIAIGSIIGGQVGAKVGRKLPPWGLRAIIIVVGIVALAKLLV
ncbi:MAG: sulfite exporter TauE/SafE family protein [Streptosporangiales bacterium]|nr:sulfite exporter TauE/SafE family protein [Streptosporangiales bacterium]